MCFEFSVLNTFICLYCSMCSSAFCFILLYVSMFLFIYFISFWTQHIKHNRRGCNWRVIAIPQQRSQERLGNLGEVCSRALVGNICKVLRRLRHRRAQPHRHRRIENSFERRSSHRGIKKKTNLRIHGSAEVSNRQVHGCAHVFLLHRANMGPLIATIGSMWSLG